jgi:hypothetical protein
VEDDAELSVLDLAAVVVEGCGCAEGYDVLGTDCVKLGFACVAVRVDVALKLVFGFFYVSV